MSFTAVQSAGGGELQGWLSLNGAGAALDVGLLLLLVLFLTLDAIWLLAFIVWVLGLSKHDERPDNTLYLP